MRHSLHKILRLIGFLSVLANSHSFSHDNKFTIFQSISNFIVTIDSRPCMLFRDIYKDPSFHRGFNPEQNVRTNHSRTFLCRSIVTGEYSIVGDWFLHSV